MTNQFNDLSSEIMEEIQETSSSPSIYKPDDNLINKGYDWDSSGLYIPYTFRYEKNPDSRDIYLKIERVPDKKTEFIIYSWNYKVNGEFKRLNFFRRDFLPVEEEIESGGKSSINKKLSHLGRLASLDAEQGSYKEFFEGLIMDIINSDGLEVFKELDYIFPVPDEEDIEEVEDSQILDEIESRRNPELTDDQVQEAMEVKRLIHEKGLIKYWDDIVDKFHVGNHREIYRKHLGGVNVIRGRGSYFIYTKAKSEAGKSLEDLIGFLLMIPERYIFKKNQMTLASFSRYGDINERYFERMLIYFGDLGNKKSYEKVEDVFDAIKTLITEGEFSRDLTEGNSSKYNKSLDLKADSIGAVFQTVRYNFLGEEEEQIASRSIKSTPMDSNIDEVLNLLFALKMEDSKENQAQNEVLDDIRKYHSYLLWLIKQKFKIVNPFRSFFKRFVRNSTTIFRDFNQVLELFEAFCILTFEDCKKQDGRLISSQEQLKTFIAEISLENVLPPEESNFLKMIMSEGNKTELKVFDKIEDEDDNPLEDYEEEILSELGYNKREKRYNTNGEEYIIGYDSFGDLEFSKRQSAIAKLLEMYRLGGTGINHKENVFFRINDVQRIHSSKRAFKDIDDVGNLLDKLYSNLYLEKLEYMDNRGRNIYYLTAKCNELNNPVKVEMDDIIDAENFKAEQGLSYAEPDEIKAEWREESTE